MEEHNDIRQGFICPFCFIDLGDFPSLSDHVNRNHPEEGGGDALEQIKGFLGKAKRGIKKLDTKFDIENLKGRMGGLSVAASSASSQLVSSLQREADSVRERKRSRSREGRESGEKREQRQPRRPPVQLPHYKPTIGATNSHMDYFTRCRDSCINETAVLTNTLIIRLDRLINETPDDPVKRKAFERDVVPWSEDSESPLCRSCGVKFSLTRRRHHCRLCGRVICNSCSQYLSFLSARKLTNPALAAAMIEVGSSDMEGAAKAEQSSILSAGERLAGLAHRKGGQLMGLLSKAREGGEVSVEGLLDMEEEKETTDRLRVCQPCLSLLARREEQMESRDPPTLISLYEALSALITELSNLAPSFSRMATSLNNGETMYTLESAEQIRQKMAIKQKEIDVISKKIEGDFEEGTGPREQHLRKNVRYVAIQTLQSIVTHLPSIPSPSEYSQLVDEHRERIARQVEESRQRAQRMQREQTDRERETALLTRASSSSPALAQPRRDASRPHLPTSSSFVGRSTDDGWTPQTTKAHNPFADESQLSHPLCEQRDIIKSYLHQAIESGRLEEVEILERNLKDLEVELEKMGIVAN